MRLLHRVDLGVLVLEQFDHDPPPYAILSHMWGNSADEVLFQDVRNWNSSARYEKLLRCEKQTRAYGLKYFWVDTCCIDKSSSEELFEAINSMFAYYANASVCFAYLSDVEASSSHQEEQHLPSTALKNSRWFTRGWTLQELIASKEVIFFSKEWTIVGTKETLKDQISSITGIQPRVLEGADLRLFSVSERMSWMANRDTTRGEDIAYSLMGIFGIQMPLFYGEGTERAFLRLQEEIIKISDDQSIFAWKDSSPFPETYTGLLARSPQYFSESKNIQPLGIWGRSKDFSMTNKGLRVDLFFHKHLRDQNVYLASLDCCFDNSFDKSPTIYLKCISGNLRLEDSESSLHFARVHVGTIDISDVNEKMNGRYRTIYVKQDFSVAQTLAPSLTSGMQLFQIKYPPGHNPALISPSSGWNAHTQMFSSTETNGLILSIFFGSQGVHSGITYLVFVGLKQGWPWTHIASGKDAAVHVMSYEPSGNEGRQCQIAAHDKTLPIRLVSTAHTIEVYRKVVHLIKIDVMYLPK